MELIFSPFDVSFVQRALIAGCLAAILCACVGTWVILRGLTFFGDAMSHGMLPGVAIASLMGGNLMIGAAISAIAMSLGVVWTTRTSKLSQDVSIGLQFIAMLSLGVVIVSHSSSFAVDLTAFLFGDVLGVTWTDILTLTVACCLGVATTALFHRRFTALTFDERKAHTLKLNPKSAHIVMLTLIALATVASFQVVGTLLVFGLLIGPPAAAFLCFRSIPGIMVAAAAIGCAQTFIGLLASWHFDTAAGATITFISAVTVFAILLTKKFIKR